MSNNDDDLLRRARELQDKVAGAGSDSVDSRPAISRKLRNSGWYRRLSERVNRLLGFLGPVGRLIGGVFSAGARWFRWAAFEDSDGGRRSFSLFRLFTRTVLSGLAVFALHVLWCALYFYATAFEETVYVTGKQEIETGELYQFGGCTSLPCSTESDNGKFYLIESSLYFPTMLYPEENVFANIPHQDAACHVEGYGIYFRSMRWIYKSLQLYQHVVDVRCRPYTEEEIRRAVLEGKILGS